MAPFNSTPAANVAGQRGFFALELPFSEELAVLVHREKRGRQRVGASMIQLVKPSLLVCVETCGKQWDIPATEETVRIWERNERKWGQGRGGPRQIRDETVANVGELFK